MANKLPENLWELMESCFKDRNPVPEFPHSRLMELFYKYLLCGGMPDAVNTFVERNDLPSVRNVQRAIYHAYEADITKYVENAIERKHIKNIYESIPAQLNSQNKRFKFTKLGNGSRFAHMQTAFDWLESAGIALPAMRTSTPEYPLGLSADVSSFKLFMNDVGLLTSRLMGNTDINILNGRSSMNFGSIFENVVAQELRTAGFELFYYNNNRIGEVDFLVQNNRGQISLIEVKSGKDYKRHRAMSNLLAIDNYDFAHSYVFHDGNVRIEGHIEYLPIYMVNLLSPYSS